MASASEVQYVNQPTAAPTAKVSAGLTAGSIATVVGAVVTICAYFGIAIPADISTAAVTLIGLCVTAYSLVQTIITFVVSYYKKERKV